MRNSEQGRDASYRCNKKSGLKNTPIDSIRNSLEREMDNLQLTFSVQSVQSVQMEEATGAGVSQDEHFSPQDLARAGVIHGERTAHARLSFWDREACIPIHYVAAILVMAVVAGAVWLKAPNQTSYSRPSSQQIVDLPTGVFTAQQLGFGGGGNSNVH